MSASFSINSSTGSYDVTVGVGLFNQALAEQVEAQFVADEFFREYLKTLPRQPILLSSDEKTKSLEHLPDLVEQMRRTGVNRGSTLIALGGGVIQDVVAFCGSIYMRGLPWSYVPTTVLAMVDSCIGGKSSINVGPYKNLVGTFHPPQHIQIDPLLAQTLPPEQFASGLVEAAKICFCHGFEAFSDYLSHTPSVDMSITALEQVILKSLLSKKYFIEVDEFDRKERLLLNFGHTFGHALEGASSYGIPHGIAVGLGIQCSLAFQRQRGISYDSVLLVSRLEKHLDALIRSLPGVEEQLSALNILEVLERLKSDKKHTRDHYTLILISAAGAVQLEQHPRTPDTDLDLRQAIAATIESYVK